MGAQRLSIVVVSIAVLLGAVACSGSDGDDEASEAPSEESTTTEAESQEDSESGFRADGTIEVFGFETDVSAVVANPETYSLTFEGDGAFDQQIRVGGRVWLRLGPDAATAAGRPWREETVTFGTRVAALSDLSRFPPPEEELAGTTGADLAGDALIEVLLTDPTRLVTVEQLDAAESDLEPELPDEIAEALDELGVDPPDLELHVMLDEKQLVEAALEISSPGVSFDVNVTYSDQGAVTLGDVVAPEESEVDQTPWLDEEALTDFRGAEFVMPAAPPAGLVLVGAYLMDAAFTPEGCSQVELVYDSPPDEAAGERYLTLYLLPKDCATSFDPTPFDETFGGFPSRFDGFEVMVGTTAVQLLPAEAVVGELEAVAASLGPTTLDAVIAAVVAPE